VRGGVQVGTRVAVRSLEAGGRAVVLDIAG
jgi:hypothetical protein